MVRTSALGLVVSAMVLSLAGCERSLLAVRRSGDEHYARGEYEEAQADYKQYIERAPGRAEVHSMMGLTLIKLGQPGQAREQALLADTLAQENDEIFANTCQTLFEAKEYEALNRLLRTKTVDRGRSKDFLLLAEFSVKQGDADEAQRAFLVAAQLDGGMSAPPHLGLARLYLSLQPKPDTQRAVERLRMAYFVDPSNGDVIDLARKMGEIVGPTFGRLPFEATPEGQRRLEVLSGEKIDQPTPPAPSSESPDGR